MIHENIPEKHIRLLLPTVNYPTVLAIAEKSGLFGLREGIYGIFFDGDFLSALVHKDALPILEEYGVYTGEAMEINGNGPGYYFDDRSAVYLDGTPKKGIVNIRIETDSI